MILCVGLRNVDGLDLEGLDLEVDLVIFEITSWSMAFYSLMWKVSRDGKLVSDNLPTWASIMVTKYWWFGLGWVGFYGWFGDFVIKSSSTFLILTTCFILMSSQPC